MEIVYLFKKPKHKILKYTNLSKIHLTMKTINVLIKDKNLTKNYGIWVSISLSSTDKRKYSIRFLFLSI
jgi:hypothetical protein